MNKESIITKLAIQLQDWASRGAYNPDDMAANTIAVAHEYRLTKDLMDHELNKLINELTSTAQDYCHAKCLRGELKKVLFKHLHIQ